MKCWTWFFFFGEILCFSSKFEIYANRKSLGRKQFKYAHCGEKPWIWGEKFSWRFFRPSSINSHSATTEQSSSSPLQFTQWQPEVVRFRLDRRKSIWIESNLLFIFQFAFKPLLHSPLLPSPSSFSQSSIHRDFLPFNFHCIFT